MPIHNTKNLQMLLLFLFYPFGFVAFSQGATPPETAEDLLERAATSMTVLPSPIAMSVDVDIRSISRPENHHAVTVHESLLRWDGTRFDMSSTESRGSEGGAPQADLSPFMEVRIIWDGEQSVGRQKILDLPEPAYVWVAADPEHYINILKGRQQGGFLLGRLYEGEDVVEILQKVESSKLREADEDVDGHPCRVVEGRTPHGVITLWIDPAAGYLLRRATVQKSPGDLLLDQPLEEGTTAIVELKDVEIERFGEIFLPVAGTMVYHVRRADGSEFEDVEIARRHDIQLDPDFDGMGAFVMDKVREGRRVASIDHPGLRYFWRDGKVVLDDGAETIKAIDEEIERIRGTRQKGEE